MTVGENGRIRHVVLGHVLAEFPFFWSRSDADAVVYVIVTPLSTMKCTRVASVFSVDCGVTNLIHDRRSCVDFMLEVRRMWLDVSTQA